MNQVLLSLLGPYKRLNLSFAAKVQKNKRKGTTHTKEGDREIEIH